MAVAAALNEAGIVYRTGNPWTTTNLAKTVGEVRSGGRGNPTPEQRAERTAWKAEQDAAKAQEDPDGSRLLDVQSGADCFSQNSGLSWAENEGFSCTSLCHRY